MAKPPLPWPCERQQGRARRGSCDAALRQGFQFDLEWEVGRFSSVEGNWSPRCTGPVPGIPNGRVARQKLRPRFLVAHPRRPSVGPHPQHSPRAPASRIPGTRRGPGPAPASGDPVRRPCTRVRGSVLYLKPRDASGRASVAFLSSFSLSLCEADEPEALALAILWYSEEGKGQIRDRSRCGLRGGAFFVNAGRQRTSHRSRMRQWCVSPGSKGAPSSALIREAAARSLAAA